MMDIVDINPQEIKEYNNHAKLPINTLVVVLIDDIMKVGWGCGIYILITRSGSTYIGSSTNIKKRVSSHRSNREYMFDPIEYIIIYGTRNIKDAKYLEVNLIKEVKPDLNRYCYTSKVFNKKHKINNLFRYSKYN